MNKETNEVIFISTNKDGNFYIGYKIKVQRGIRGKTKSQVDELLIIGIPRKKFKKYMQDNIDKMEFPDQERKNDDE